jgi:membrane-bound serine protease (ClpP class)
VAFILLNLGVTGIIIELWNPGSILPGALGALCLIMGLYALSVLPVNGAAAALLIIGALLAAAEAFTPTFGALAAGGLTLFVIGGIMLFPEGAQDMGVSRNLIFATAGTAAAILALILWVVVRGHSRRVSTGSQGMVGTPATVLNWQGGTGLVMAHGERWKAKGPQGLEPGDQVRVERLDGLTLSVQAEPPWRQS